MTQKSTLLRTFVSPDKTRVSKNKTQILPVTAISKLPDPGFGEEKTF
jgi:hypothetical protein